MLNPDTTAEPDITAVLTQIVGRDRVLIDPADTALYAQDIFAKGEPVSCVVSPRDTGELAQVVQAATSRGIAVVPRGGGMSYTGGYLAADGGSVLIDTSRMDRILAINETDMTVTVQCGVTWKALYEALKEKGLRTPFWGPLSGISSTIGGGLSQNNAFFGAGLYGTTGESVTSLTVVLADGSILKTGSAGTKGGKPFYRHYGPDLTGLFMGDTGALGFKAEATFRLIKAPTAERWASFEFADHKATIAATAAVAREGLASEVCGFDPNLARVRMKRASLLADAKTFVNVVTGQKSLLKGVVEGARMAMAGRSFLADASYSLHLVVEGRSDAAVDADMAVLRKICLGLGGKETENTIPKVLRTLPFTPLNNIMGPEGERWAPVHGIVAHSDALAAFEEIEALFAAMADRMEKAGVYTGYMLTTMSTNAFLIEPVFFWPGERYEIHEATIEPHFLTKLPKRDHDAAAQAIVDEARAAIKAIFLKFGGVHFQIGKTYPYREGREETAWALLEAVKSALDPQRRVNPGSLGLD